MTEHTHGHSAPPQGHILADRACVTCGFNLYGTPVHKEDHYGLVIATCPECGTAAALQDYPAQSSTVRRYKALLAASWILTLTIAFFITGSFTTAAVQVLSSNAGSDLAVVIATEHRNWEAAQNGSNPSYGYAAYAWIQQSWLDHNLDRIVQEQGGLWTNISWNLASGILGIVRLAFPVGLFWGLALLGASKKRVTIVLAVACALGWVFNQLPNMTTNSATRHAIDSYTAAAELFAPVLGPIALAIFFACSVLGILAARPLARWVVVAALPPRLRGPFGILWTRDNLEPPSPRTV